MIFISDYTQEDRESLFQLYSHWNKNFTFDYELFKGSLDQLVSENSRLLLAKDQGELQGYAQIIKCTHLGMETFYEVMQLLVSEESRGKGIGKALMEKVEEIALEDNIFLIKLSSQLHRSRAHVFYENLGFTVEKMSKFYEKRL
jgi:PhnO protein